MVFVSTINPLINPLRWAPSQFSLKALLSDPTTKKVVTIALIVIMVVGIALLAYHYCLKSRKLEAKKSEPLQLEFVHTPMLPLEDGVRSLPVIGLLNEDLQICVVSYLNPRSLLSLRQSSKIFLKACNSPIIWSGEQYLGHPDYRIWGATTWNCLYVKGNGYKYNISVQESLDNPLKTLKTYKNLKAQNAIDDFFLDYIARLMPGGPVAYSKIAHKDIDDPSKLQPDEMGNDSIIRGKTGAGDHFLALRILDAKSNDMAAKVLVFIHELSLGRSWKQLANDYWNANQLRVGNKDCLNYLLNIISKKVHSSHLFSGFREGVHLY